MPLTLMYAIVRRHVIDIRFVISKAVVYGALMTVIFGLIAAVDWAATRFLAELRIALALDAVIAICLGVLMHRLIPVLEGWVDSVIYRGKHAAEIYLIRLARTLPRAERNETIDRALVEDPSSELDLYDGGSVSKSWNLCFCSATVGRLCNGAHGRVRPR